MFYKKDIAELKKDLSIKANILDNILHFKTRWGVFSPKSIDEGTLLLLKYISVDNGDVCLDLGCGYGVIGIAAAKHCTDGSVHMVDKDFVAIELSCINAKLNDITNTNIYLSDAFMNIDNGVKFNQIFSNIPAKVGREQLAIILYDCFDYLKTGGSITFVTINGLRDFIKTNFKLVFGNYEKLKQGTKYTVARAIKI